MVCSGQGVVDGTGEELQGVCDAVFRSECGLDYIGVPVLHSVTDYFSLGHCIDYSMTSVVVETRAYTVSSAAAKPPCQACVGIAVYTDTAD